MVEESPGKLEYEVALFRESGVGVGSGSGGNGGAESPVDQAVPIGTKLQLRATIGANSGRPAWRSSPYILLNIKFKTLFLVPQQGRDSQEKNLLKNLLKKLLKWNFDFQTCLNYSNFFIFLV